MINLDNLKTRARAELATARTNDELEAWRVKYLGRSSDLSLFLRSLAEKTLEEKRELGPKANGLKQELERLLFDKQKIAGTRQPVRSGFDITEPGKNLNLGHLHPITQVKNELNDAFKFLGFEIYEGPEISSEGYDFDVLNFPKDHPARESMDTYWIKPETDVLGNGLKRLDLRPHLTGMSVRYMQAKKKKEPFRFVYPGRAFRSEATDAGHERCFYQYEALIVNKDISLSGGKILVTTILERVFGRQVEVRMRPGFFPFVEPGFEIDMQCLNCSGRGCSVCKWDGWVEMMPGGPPHPNVLKAGGFDPKVWQGFYINIGLDRITMMKHGIDDIRLMHSGDLRFLNQF
ncbi:MAG: phenylalanine--tRNA ligase subunit alpha [Candidatus Brennerbacteria bacterium RIFOXYC1_FULL_41_11]|nr:MAG: phenylalanine--tRNA ligase subunit alpha [Candidatus Brennerbacteria bacterium RIFOXYC1_FULL_41_11]